MNTQTFSYMRMTSIMKRHATMNLKSNLIEFGVMADVLLLILFVSMYNGHFMNTKIFTGVAFPIIFMGGLVFTSLIFREMHQPLTSHTYLMLPASTAEKLAAYWLLSSIVFLLVSVVLLYIVNLLLATAGYFILDTPFFVVNLFTTAAFKFYGSYMVVHSVFLLGAVAFRNLNFLKTILATISVAIVIGLLSLFGIFSIFGNALESNETHQFSLLTADISCTAVPCTLTIAVVAILWASAYYKLKEKQI